MLHSSKLILAPYRSLKSLPLLSVYIIYIIPETNFTVVGCIVTES